MRAGFDARRGKEEVVREVQALTDGLGVEAAINVSGHETAAVLPCAVARMHGRMIQIAQPDQVSVPFHKPVFRDLRIVGSLIKVTTNVFHGLNEVPKMEDLAHSGKMQG